ncbi:FecCD family ABC transporter permease [Dongia sedimenti]|uniref:Iron ABC transporter permease n=1 Tax=Dongia sedimenti TaxID=3064282 RepID=A0ABU0YJL4_9PROT|nr:iron ABC transporter permease [Rhodospirillaceae bacterium R-7]
MSFAALDVRRRGWLVVAALALLLVFSVVYSITLGRYGVSMTNAWLILWDHIVPVANPTWSDVDANVVTAVRLPRILGALLVGAGLAISGAALQGLFRNPLVDPGIIGVTAGAGFGGTLAILMVGGGTVVLGAAFGCGIASLLVVRFLATVKGRTSTLTFVLAGVVVTAFFEAAISIIKLLADPHQKLPAITYWLMGSIAATGYSDLALMAAAIVPPSILIFMLRYQINILSLGEEKARALGSPIERVQWIVYAAVACISAGVVATSGIVGWVGLVIPHLARGLVGPDHGRLLPVSALLGAIYLLLVDDIARTATVAELPIGIITALVGVPVFALILRRLQSKSGWAHD